MVRVSVHYPAAPGKKFDMEYYLNKHVALTKQRYGDAFLGFEVYEGASGGDGGPPSIAVTAHFYFESPERLIDAAQKHNAELLADIANFTDIVPSRAPGGTFPSDSPLAGTHRPCGALIFRDGPRQSDPLPG